MQYVDQWRIMFLELLGQQCIAIMAKAARYLSLRYEAEDEGRSTSLLRLEEMD